MVSTIDNISKKISEDFHDIDKKAKNLIHILICGSYKSEEDLQIIEKFRDRQKARDITGTFLMKDIKIVDENNNEIEIVPHEKMHLIWNNMKKGDNIPLFILFAGKSADESRGLSAEIQTIAHDKEKIDCAYLFKIPNVQLVSHEECFSNIEEVKDGDEFIIEGEKVIDAKLKQARMFYQAKEAEK